MADQSDVEAALAGAVGGALYPQGLSGPCAVAGTQARIYRGWPMAAALQADLQAGVCNVSILAVEGTARNTARWPDAAIPLTTAAATLFADVAGQSVRFSGTAADGQVAAVIADAATVAYRMIGSDSPQSVAAKLARLMQAQRAAELDGAVLTVPGAVRLVARVEADQPTLRMTGRRSQTFRVSCWCPDPPTRDALGAAVELALSAYDFLGLADGTSGRIRFEGASVSDARDDVALFRREILYGVDYAVTQAAVLPRMAVGIATMPPAQTAIS